jgi:hypothetical protein
VNPKGSPDRVRARRGRTMPLYVHMAPLSLIWPVQIAQTYVQKGQIPTLNTHAVRSVDFRASQLLPCPTWAFSETNPFSTPCEHVFIPAFLYPGSFIESSLLPFSYPALLGTSWPMNSGFGSFCARCSLWRVSGRAAWVGT